MKKIIFITGASSGIGKETASVLIKKGFTVYCAARRTQEMEDLKNSGGKIIRMDITDDSSIEKAVDTIISEAKRIDILINNAGYGCFGAMEDTPIDDARYQFEVNLFGLARLTQLVLPHMRMAKSGRIINISSMGGKFGEPHGCWYHASKFALEGFSDCLRMELKQFGIDVVLIEPGIIKTQWDSIAQGHLSKLSGDSPYACFAKKHSKFLAKSYDSGSHPSVIAKEIIKAVYAKKPKIRYIAGSKAAFILLVKKFLPDNVFDYIMLQQIK